MALAPDDYLAQLARKKGWTMSTHHLVDPELLPMIDAFPKLDLSAGTLEQARAAIHAGGDTMPEPPIAPVQHLAKSRDGGPDVPVLVFKPEGDKRRAAIVHIHGGGMVMGTAFSLRRWPSTIAANHDVVVVSVDYRLAPETTFPGPQEDCYAALDWLVAQADSLGVDVARIAVMGESAGGGLAAALAQMVRDRGEHRLCGQILVYPMIDHRTGGPDDRYCNPTVGEFIWTRQSNQFGWACLQGDYALDDDRIGWFSPSLAQDLSGLAPAYIALGTLDLFFDEDLDYARRLCAAGVPTELHSYAGAFHGFNAMAEAGVTQEFVRNLDAAIARMLARSGG